MSFRADVRPSRRVLGIAVGLVAANVALFLAIAEDLADGGGLIARDQAVLTWFVDHRTDAWINVARAISTLGSFLGLAALAIALGIWIRLRSWSWPVAAAPLVSLTVANLCSTTAKAYFGRERPPVALRASTVTLNAFPSGHATDAAAFFVAAAFVTSLTVARTTATRVGVVLGAATCAGLIGISRLVLAVHWLSDVVAGWALGTAVAIAVVTLCWRLTTAIRSAG